MDPNLSVLKHLLPFTSDGLRRKMKPPFGSLTGSNLCLASGLSSLSGGPAKTNELVKSPQM